MNSVERPAASEPWSWPQSFPARVGEAARDALFGSSIRRGPGLRRALALTFDDGPSPGTLEIAELLAEYRIQATFFVCGQNVLRHPGIVRCIAGAGHELGNHTFSHARLCPRLGWRLNLRSPGANRREFERAQDIIASVTGVVPRLMRPPYGLRWWGLRRTARELGLRNVLWTAIAHDWEWPAGAVAPHVLRLSAPGGILCFHDGRETRSSPDLQVTVAALRRVLPVLLRRGFHFETVSELLRTDAEAGQGTLPAQKESSRVAV